MFQKVKSVVYSSESALLTVSQEQLLYSEPSQEPFGPEEETCELPHDKIIFIMHQWKYRHFQKQPCNLSHIHVHTSGMCGCVAHSNSQRIQRMQIQCKSYNHCRIWSKYCTDQYNLSLRDIIKQGKQHLGKLLNPTSMFFVVAFEDSFILYSFTFSGDFGHNTQCHRKVLDNTCRMADQGGVFHFKRGSGGYTLYIGWTSSSPVQVCWRVFCASLTVQAKLSCEELLWKQVPELLLETIQSSSKVRVLSTFSTKDPQSLSLILWILTDQISRCSQG